MQINVTILGGECPRTFKLEGRIGHTLSHLHVSGTDGITLKDNPALGLAVHVLTLLKLGFIIDAEPEMHEGDYPGVLARHGLVSVVKVYIGWQEVVV